jgi:membrane fusion protein (multidrug efflux system)
LPENHKKMATTTATQQAMEEKSALSTYLPRIIIGLVLIVGGYFGFKAFRHGQQYESTDNAQIEGNTAPVLARVAGYVKSVTVNDYATVKQGQTLVTIDPQEYDVALAQAEADYQQTVADLATAQADLQNAQANARNVTQNLRVAQSNADVQASRRDKAQNDLKRDQNLYAAQSLTQKQLEDSRNTADVQARQYTANEAQVSLARTSQGVAQAGIAKAQSNIQKIQAVLKVKQAAIDNAKLRLGYAQLVAPISGKLGRKNVVVGQYVQPGQNLMTIVADSTFWIVANFKETQLEKMQLGQEVDIKVDAYPDLAIKGKVSSLSEATGARFALLPPDNSSGNFVKITQRVPVKIDIINPEKYKNQLRAGLSVDAEVRVAN